MRPSSFVFLLPPSTPRHVDQLPPAVSIRRLCRHLQCPLSRFRPCTRLLGGLPIDPSYRPIGEMFDCREQHETGRHDPVPWKLSLNSLQVVASLGHRVVAWSLSGPRNDYWRVHSSLQLSEDQHITALNCISGDSSYYPSFSLFDSTPIGLLAVATRSSLSVYTLILENDLPTWSRKWSSTYVQHSYTTLCMYVHPRTNRVPALSLVRFSPSLMYISTTSLVSPTNMYDRRDDPSRAYSETM